MFKSRRNKSLGGKGDSRNFNHITIPPKDASAIVPPKRVIKALYDYNAPSDPPHYLSFSQGDFLHVVARENDDDWYEACNPLQGTRGLVPVKYFETVGKTTRDSRGSDQSTPHDSGFGDAQSNASPGHRQSKSIGKMGGAMVYGIVAYDFHAERPDELDAKAGEAIIVIAQSNPEWFVAKPITRLGGPGLIPVSFIDIKDMQTGQTVTDSSEAIAKAGIPRVEEWKKMAAEYKNTSIALGHIAGPPAQPSRNSALSTAMGRMSLNAAPANQRLSRSSARASLPVLQAVSAHVPRFTYSDDKFHFIIECTFSNGAHWDLSRIYEDFYELQIQLIQAFPSEAGKTPENPRILPFMPGPVPVVNDSISEGRRVNLDTYLVQLLSLGPHISRSSLVQGFFAQRPGDYEIDPADVEALQHGQAPVQRLSTQGAPPQHQRQVSSVTTLPATQHMRSASDESAAPQPTPVSAGAPLKVKVWFDRNTCVVLRLPPKGQFTFVDLQRKIVERRAVEGVGTPGTDIPLEIEYRDERDGEYYKLGDEDELREALEGNERLTLVVREGSQ